MSSTRVAKAGSRSKKQKTKLNKNNRMSENKTFLSQSKEHRTILFTTLMAHRYYELIKHLIGTGQEKTFSSLENHLKKREQVPVDLCYEAFLFVFTLVDHIVRYYKICKRMPDIEVDGQKSVGQLKAREELKAHLGALKEARDKQQHIDERITDDGEGSFLGSISWNNNGDNYTLFWTQTGQLKSTLTIPYDTIGHKHTSRFCYTQNGVIYDLDKAIEILERHHRWLSNTIKPEKPYSPGQEFVGFHYVINLK